MGGPVAAQGADGIVHALAQPVTRAARVPTIADPNAFTCCLMIRPSLRAVLAGSPDELEAAFYDALQQGDLERLMACWADDDEVICVHPDGARLLGPLAIRAAFAAMLERGGLQVQATQVHRVQALASSVHSVLELVRVVLPDGAREAVVHATNVYHKTPRGWRLVAHHASAGQMHEAGRPSSSAHMLH